jgi:hypothetical protein
MILSFVLCSRSRAGRTSSVAEDFAASCGNGRRTSRIGSSISMSCWTRGEAGVVARMRQSARGKASGTPVEQQYGMVFHLRDRRIARMDVYMSQTDALKAVGLEE